MPAATRSFPFSASTIGNEISIYGFRDYSTAMAPNSGQSERLSHIGISCL